MKYTPLIDHLIEALRCQSGIGPKSAQRIAFELLERNRPGARQLAEALQKAMDGVQHCERCRNFSEAKLCDICTSPKRDSSLLCVVESPANVVAIEQTSSFFGRYFVLMGNLSPLDGIGPDEIGLDKLKLIVEQDHVKEVILATGTTLEGEATAHYISQMFVSTGIKVTRIAHGVPLGGELDLIDGGTLSHALTSRQEI
ncbi:MAG: recombination mediator RecR [Gammaproteobacteria bacterium]